MGYFWLLSASPEPLSVIRNSVLYLWHRPPSWNMDLPAVLGPPGMGIAEAFGMAIAEPRVLEGEGSATWQ